MAVSGISSSGYDSYYTYNYSYNNGISSDSWVDSANQKTSELKKTLGISDTENTTSNSTATSTSGFLMGYQSRLEDLEASASKLQTSNKDNVFANYEKALASQAKGEEGADKKVTSAEDDVVSAVKDLVKNYNDTISYLKKNGSFGEGLSSQMESLKRAIPSEQGLKYLGMSFDTSGNLKVDEDKLRETLQKDPEFVKDSFGGQYGIAERLGSKATAILDSSVDKIMGSGATDSSGDAKKTTSSNTVATYTGSGGSSDMNDSFKQFATFARSGAFNLSNYYAVSMLNILV